MFTSLVIGVTFPKALDTYESGTAQHVMSQILNAADSDDNTGQQVTLSLLVERPAVFGWTMFSFAIAFFLTPCITCLIDCMRDCAQGGGGGTGFSSSGQYSTCECYHCDGFSCYYHGSAGNNSCDCTACCNSPDGCCYECAQSCNGNACNNCCEGFANSLGNICDCIVSSLPVDAFNGCSKLCEGGTECLQACCEGGCKGLGACCEGGCEGLGAACQVCGSLDCGGCDCAC